MNSEIIHIYMLACIHVAGGFRGWGRGVWHHRKSREGEKAGRKRAKADKAKKRMELSR